MHNKLYQEVIKLKKQMSAAPGSSISSAYPYVAKPSMGYSMLPSLQQQMAKL